MNQYFAKLTYNPLICKCKLNQSNQTIDFRHLIVRRDNDTYHDGV